MKAPIDQKTKRLPARPFSKPGFRVELSEEEILADLRYPAPSRARRRA